MEQIEHIHSFEVVDRFSDVEEYSNASYETRHIVYGCKSCGVMKEQELERVRTSGCPW